MNGEDDQATCWHRISAIASIFRVCFQWRAGDPLRAGREKEDASPKDRLPYLLVGSHYLFLRQSGRQSGHQSGVSRCVSPDISRVSARQMIDILAKDAHHL
jgi:hypothetical protein